MNTTNAMNATNRLFKMYIDDIRNPKSYFDRVVRTSQEAIDFVRLNFCPNYISFDHDLGEDDTSMVFIKWLIQEDLNNNGEIIPNDFTYNVHSANPIGKANIEGYLKSYLTQKGNKMNKFKEFLKENRASEIEIYHGDNFNTNKLNSSLMNNGNNQEGVGIYFSNNISTAKSYGKNIIKIQVNKSKLIDARADISKIGKAKIQKLLRSLMKYNLEGTYYYISNYIEIHNPEDLTVQHIDEVVKYLLQEQIRNFQVTLATLYGVENFVKEWNKIVKIDGTFQKQNDDEIWYAIINDKIQVENI